MAKAPLQKPEVCYFCDESSQVKDDWLAVAGLAVMRSAIPRITADLALIKKTNGKTGEVKWENAKSYGGRVHRGYIDLLFGLIAERKAQFHIRFSPMAEYDHGLSGPRKKIDTVSRSFYQLLLHRPVRYYTGKADVWVYPDDGECTSELPGYQAALCQDGANQFGENAWTCVQDIQCRASKGEPMLQLLDVTLGALATMKNGRHLAEGYSPVKRELAEHAFAKTGWLTINGNSWSKACNRWTVVPKIKRGP